MRHTNSGFTMIEVMITLAILVILAGLAVPGYFRSVEISRANEARANLNIIHMGEKIYYVNNSNVFWGSGGNVAVGPVNTALNTDMSAVYYTTFNIALSNLNQTYTATLTRNTAEGGAGTKWFRYTYTYDTLGTAPTLSEGGAY